MSVLSERNLTWEQTSRTIQLKTEMQYPEIVTGKSGRAKVSQVQLGGRERKRTYIDCGKRIRTRTAKRCTRCACLKRMPLMWKARKQKATEKTLSPLHHNFHSKREVV